MKWPTEQVELTYEDRATFGTCPVCGVPHGSKCLPCGMTLGGDYPKDGVHLGRLQQAPKVRVISYA